MKVVVLIFLILIGSPAFAMPNFAGKWHVIDQVVYDNCWGTFGQINTFDRVIKQKGSVLTSKSKLTGLVSRGVVTSSTKFKLVVNFWEDINGEQVHSVFQYNFYNLKNYKGKITVDAQKLFPDGVLCHVISKGVVTRK